MLSIGVDASRAFVENKTGTESYSYSVLRAMLELDEARGYRWVLFVRPPFVGLDEEWLNREGVEIVRIGWPRLWTQAGLAFETWRRKLDVLWIPAHTMPVLGRPDITKVVTIHGIEYEWLPEYRNNLQRWYLPLSTMYASKVADKIIAVSRFTADSLVERFGVDSEKVKVVYEGVDSEFFGAKRSDADIGRVLEKYGVDGDYLFFVGSIQPRKNLVFMIEAYSKLRSRYKDLKLVLAGSRGWLCDGVYDAPRVFGVEDGVVFTGRVSDEELACFMQGARLYVQPSITEGFGLPVLEAMSAGCPVVVSDGGALPELVVDPGVQVARVSDLEDWIEKISNVLSDERVRERLVRDGFEKAREFSWKRTARESLRVLVDD